MIIAAAVTDKGKHRITNQDSVFCSVEPVGGLPSLFVVADGMGGEKAGDYASSSFIDEFVRLIRSDGKSRNTLGILRHAVENANLKLYMESCSDPDREGMGTTLVCAVVDYPDMLVANVGDSRLYLLSDTIKQITRDHSYVQEMVDKGLMHRDSSEYRDKKNFITRAIGIGMRVDEDYFDIRLNDGETVLICSDGLTDMVDDSDILKIVRGADSLQKAAEQLVEAANANGGRDNISVVLFRNDSGGEK